jgi:hypothetical protein
MLVDLGLSPFFERSHKLVGVAGGPGTGGAGLKTGGEILQTEMPLQEGF